VCCLHRAHEDEEREFLDSALKPRSMVCEWFGIKTTRTGSHRFGPQNRWRWFGLKTTRMIFIGLASKPVVMFSTGLALKHVATVSDGLASKPAVTVFRFGPRNR
jgi:hypothetical protein